MGENIDQPLAAPHCLKQFHDTVPKEIMIETLTYLPLSEMGNVLRISKSIHSHLTETPRYFQSVFVSYCSNTSVPRSTIDSYLKSIETMSTTDAHQTLTSKLQEMVAHQKKLRAKREEAELIRKRMQELMKMKTEQEKQLRELKEQASRMRLEMNTRKDDATK
ncbi:hypothetical protein C9374_010474 [Naegleria lovaniensis]|uniref:F-box domain-containing protein n=1 Tax=Naegleria lovaniensis TaxID=51637 RepID=A0AA88GBP0_NAELO|nr:uncharacterized protein C9374_010474 [Naegleria lovaniensis]KAG2374730.1 hypothetical protein C9374_010474 [Naegleria lovaniensis]